MKNMTTDYRLINVTLVLLYKQSNIYKTTSLKLLIEINKNK